MNKWTPRKALLLAWLWTVLAVLLSFIAGAAPGMLPVAGIACVIAIVFWVLRSRLRRAESAPAAPTPPVAASAPVAARAAAEVASAKPSERRTLPGYLLVGAEGYVGTDIEAEFAYMDGIHRVVGRAPRLDEEIVVEDLVAALVPEPSNKYDPNAVMVQINGQLVGYLAREDAERYNPVLSEIIAYGFAPATRARIWASSRETRNNRVKPVANVRIALNEPHLLIPLNDPPTTPYSIVPWGNGLQVTGEEHHQDALAPYVTAHGDGIALGTLAIILGGTAKAPKDVVEVRIDGERIGQLTPASSLHFVPTVRHLAERGQDAVVWLRVKGNALTTQVTLQATKAVDLPADWFDEAQTIPRLRSGAGQALGEP